VRCMGVLQAFASQLTCLIFQAVTANHRLARIISGESKPGAMHVWRSKISTVLGTSIHPRLHDRHSAPADLHRRFRALASFQ
jgi:hypothetical protein